MAASGFDSNSSEIKTWNNLKIWTGGSLTKIHLIEIVFYQLIEIFIIS